MTTPRARSPRQRTEDRRPQIADAALRIVATRGVAQLTAAEIGREVGIADSTIFRHFRDMDEVILVAIERVQACLAESFPAATGPALTRLRAFFLARLALVRQRPEILRLATSDRLEQVAGAEGARRLRDSIQRSKQFIDTCLREAQASGDISSELDPVVLGWVVRGTLQSAVAASVRQPPSALPSAETTWNVLDALLRGRPRAAKKR
ncbi:MAG: TetR/AcrR family transcriptional regulator [Myxococcales bacterium]|nr:TetR/AcrR family transcriptional regulator [Myxococcales bacterium]